MVLYDAECTELEYSFKSLPSSLPESPPNSSLSPHIDMAFLEAEGPWPSFNKAMHSAFCDKSNGLKIQKRGKNVKRTMANIRWVLKKLEGNDDAKLAPLVKMWIDALRDAGKAAGSGTGAFIGEFFLHFIVNHCCGSRSCHGTLTEILKMLSLDVHTRWYSAYQMCRKHFSYINESFYLFLNLERPSFGPSKRDW